MRTQTYKTNRRNTNSRQPKIITIGLAVLRLVFGAVFVFSGFVKAIDPLGSTYKIEDYLTAFGGFFTYFLPLAFPVAILLSSIELLIGLNMVFKIRYRLTTFIALLFMIVMTGLTLYIAIADPVSDCGCFGDAVIISNTATFVKNLFLLAIIITLFATRKNSYPFFTPAVDWAICFLFFLVGVGLSIHSYRYLPMIDFRPYKVGVNLAEAMYIPPGQGDKYETFLIYEKEGVKKEFTLQNYPANDSTWTFVDQKSVLIEKGYEPPIHDFAIIDPEYMEDITEEVVQASGYTYLLIAYDISKASEEGLIEAQKIYNNAILSGKKFYALSASSDEELENIRLKLNLSFPFYQTDPTTLKTIIRSNPGLLLLKDGTIEAKWAWRKFEKAAKSLK